MVSAQTMRRWAFLRASCQWPLVRVAGVAGVPIMSELIESRAIFNVFLCYTLLHTHCHGRLERKRRAK
jgi:hypothetical protein